MKSWLILVGIVTMLGALGCGAANPPTNQVTGTVTLDGKPVADANVQFMPVDIEATSAFGKTDASGVYTLRTFGESDGAMPGKFKVSVKKTEQVQQGVQKDGEHVGEPILVDKNVLPEKYMTKASTPLEFEVKANDDNVYNIELTK